MSEKKQHNTHSLTQDEIDEQLMPKVNTPVEINYEEEVKLKHKSACSDWSISTNKSSIWVIKSRKHNGVTISNGFHETPDLAWQSAYITLKKQNEL